MYVINSKKCNGCSACLDICETGAIYLLDNIAGIDHALCSSCGACIEVCPVNAISFEHVEFQQAAISNNPSLKETMLSIAKSTIGKLETLLIPIVISKISELVSIKLEGEENSSSSSNGNFSNKGRRMRKKNRGGNKWA